MNRSLIKFFVYSAVIICVLISCGTKRFAYAPVTFEMHTPELQGYRSLTFWHNPNTYVESVPALSSNIIGTWIVTSDTLICMPKFWYSENNGRFICEAIVSSDSTVMSIPQKYIVLKNSIEEITDYSVIYDSVELKISECKTNEVIRPKLYRIK